MIFEDWWKKVYCPAQGMTELSDARAIVIASTKREAAKHAWEAARQNLLEEQSKEQKAIELENPNNAKRSRKKPH